MCFLNHVHILGSYSGYVVPISFPKVVVASMLPNGLSLAPQTLTPPDKHPLFLNIGFEDKVRPAWGSLNGPGVNYQEFIVGLPYVQITATSQGPLYYSPRIYVNKISPALGGLFWGFPKRLARIKAEHNSYQVSSYWQNEPLFTAHFTPSGDPGLPSQFPLFNEMSKILGKTTFLEPRAGSFVCNQISQDLSTQLLQPVEADLEVLKHFVSGLKVGSYSAKGIDTTVLGAFQYINPTPWQLTLPINCSKTLVESERAAVDPRLAELEKEVAALVERIRNDPEARYQTREAFYRKYGVADDDGFGFGNSELAFMRWEIERGVLNSPYDSTKAGSPWWRTVNEEFIYLSELAGRVYEANLSESGLAHPVKLWLNYIQNPAPQSWYRAHNSSIVSGYLNHISEAKQENRPEQIFINIVLYRLLYAQALVEKADIGLGELGRILSNPILPSVDVLVHLPDFYPRHYPLTEEDIKDIMDQGHSFEDELARVLDDGFILPHLSKLYRLAADWLNAPQLEKLVRDNAPIYPDISQG